MARAPVSARWLIRDIDGDAKFFTTRSEWIADWWHRIGEIEGAALPAYLRRDGLKRLHAANTAVFIAMTKQGRFDAAREASGLVDSAIRRLERGG